jgi:hypothetical protein
MGWRDDPVDDPEAPALLSSHAPAGGWWQADPVEKPELSPWDKTVNMVGRGAWALPGLVGLDHETVQSWATGTPKEKLLEQSKQVDEEVGPLVSGVTRGLAAAPGEALAWALAPEVKGPQLVAQGGRALSPVLAKLAPYVERALAYGPRSGTLAGASEYGSTAYKDPADRAVGAGIAAGTGTVLGGLMASHLPDPSVLAPAAHQATPEALAARSAAFGVGHGGEAASGAAARSGAAAAGQGGDAAAENATEIVIRSPKRSLVPKALREPEPIPEAQYLLDRGVPLTGGLRDPSSAYGHTEISSQSVGIVGPGIRKQRGAALEDAMHVAFEEARPPGAAKIGKAGDINEKYVRLKGAWDAAWDAIRGKDELIQPAILEGDFGVPIKVAIDQVIDDVADPLAAVWDDASRAQARRFLDNQITRLNAGAKDEAGRVPLGDMLRVLSDVRKAKRAALEGEKRDLYQIFARAEEAFEQALETQASPETAAEIRALNGGYRNFKTVEDAVIRAKDSPGGISPAQLQFSVRATEPSRARYAAGGGGNLRDLSKAVRTVFDESGSPPTGARLLSVAPEWLNRWATAPTIYLRNASSLKAQGGNAGALAGAGADAGATAAGGSARAGAQSIVPTSPARNTARSFLPLPRTASPVSSALTPEMRRFIEQFGYPRSGFPGAVAGEDEPK